MKNKLLTSLREINQEVILRETIKGNCKHCPAGIFSAIGERIKNQNIILMVCMLVRLSPPQMVH